MCIAVYVGLYMFLCVCGVKYLCGYPFGVADHALFSYEMVEARGFDSKSLSIYKRLSGYAHFLPRLCGFER